MSSQVFTSFFPEATDSQEIVNAVITGGLNVSSVLVKYGTAPVFGDFSGSIDDLDNVEFPDGVYLSDNFQFPEGFEYPTDGFTTELLVSLYQALIANGSLIVPEGFNIGEFLQDTGSTNNDSGETNENGTPSISFYDGSITGLDIGSGILLSTGSGEPPLTNTQSGFGEDLQGAENNHAGLEDTINRAFSVSNINDVTSLTFEVSASSANVKGVSFDVVFGSDEFPEWVDSDYVDIAGVYVNGVNYALFNGDEAQPLSILGNNIINGNFLDNATGTYDIEYDGLSPKLTIFAPLQTGTNTIEIAVGDTGDEILDSAIIISNLHGVNYTGNGLVEVIKPGDTTFADLPGNQLFEFDDNFVGEMSFSADTAGDDVVDAANAFLKAILPFASTDLSGINFENGVLTFNTPNGEKTFVGVDQVQLNDLFAAFDTTEGGNTFETMALLQLGLGAIPDTNTLSQWVAQASSAGSTAELASQIIDFYTSGNGIDDASLIAYLYQNLFGTAATQDIIDQFSGLVGTGQQFENQGELFAFAALLDQNTQQLEEQGLVGSIQLLNLDYFI